MKEMTRDQLAFHLFKVMNDGRKWHCSSEGAWEFMVDSGFHRGYLRLADEIVSKGYRCTGTP